MTQIRLQQLRKEYGKMELSESSVKPDPFLQFTHWFSEAAQAGVDELSAMFLATCGKDGKSSGRIVLLKGQTEKGFVFFTNYNSVKSKQISENPYAAITFHWKEIERQVRITGTVSRLPAHESDLYFKSRPFESRISACISPQSQVIPGREFLEKKRKELIASHKDGNVSRPSEWGGFIVKPDQIEFWQGRESRLHDRIRYRKEKKKWIIERLAP
jgi:pyridoxamine 5'-phosphate oxidase